jgi:hypothetical protein
MTVDLKVGKSAWRKADLKERMLDLRLADMSVEK